MGYRTIVLGYDGESSRPALERAAELAEAFGATLVVVVATSPPSEAIPPSPLGGPLVVAPPSISDPALEGERRSLEEAAEALLDEARRAVGARAPVETEIRVEDPVAAIVGVAEERGADLVVVGTHEPGFLERLFMGSVSRGVVGRAGREVLVVPADGD